MPLLAPSWNSLVGRIYDNDKYPLLTREEEAALYLKCRAGDQKARERLLWCFSKLVLKIARREVRTNDPEDLIELFSAGLLGLARVIDGRTETLYDPNHPSRARISTFARLRIRAKIINAKKGQRAQKRSNDVLAIPGLAVSVEELLGGVSDNSDSFSLDIFTSDDETPEEAVRMAELRDAVARAMDVLSERERIILLKRYGDDETVLGELAEEFGVSRQRIEQIQVRAEEKLKKRLTWNHPGIAGVRYFLS